MPAIVVLAGTGGLGKSGDHMIPTKTTQDNDGQFLLSTEISDLTAKRHDNVMRDIEKMLEELDVSRLSFESTYSDKQGKTRPCYKLPAREVKILITGYDVVRRAKVIDRLDELEQAERERRISGPVKAPFESTIRLCHDIMLSVPGIDPGLVTSHTLRMIQDHTGHDTESMRKLLPSLKEEPPSMNATAVGQQIGTTAAFINALLAQEGYQQRNKRGDWELTDKGAKHGGMFPYTRAGHSGYQVLWRQSIVGEIRQMQQAA